MFRKGCVDATFLLKTALQVLREHNQESHVLFVDLVKANDSVNRELLWKVLKKFGVPDETITVLKKLHDKVNYILKVGNKKVKIEGEVGVKQGDNLGPILFIYLIQAVSVTLNQKWEFEQPDFCRYGLNKEGKVKYNPPLKKSVKPKTKGVSFSFWKTYYVDNAPYLFLNQQDIESASRLITKLFK